eukprot:87285-Pelagomonas_calceolata.AAC.1
MHASEFSPIKIPIEYLEAVRGYHANTSALRIINASHACRVDFWENDGGMEDEGNGCGILCQMMLNEGIVGPCTS